MSSSPDSHRHSRFLTLLQPVEAELEVYARRMVWREADVADALQNAVMRAFAAFDRYHEDASFKAWMYRILTNECFALNRRHASRSRTEVAMECEVMDTLAAIENESAYVDWLASPDALREALDDDIALALELLTENERAVLLLRAIGGLRYHEIAETLSIPMGSVIGPFGPRPPQDARCPAPRT